MVLVAALAVFWYHSPGPKDSWHLAALFAAALLFLVLFTLIVLRAMPAIQRYSLKRAREHEIWRQSIYATGDPELIQIMERKNQGDDIRPSQ